MSKDIIHPHLIKGISSALFEIFHSGCQSDRVIGKTLKERKKWGSRDRRIFAESVYECSRWWRRLWYAAGYNGECFKPENVTLEISENLWRLWITIASPAFIKNQQRPDAAAIKRWSDPPDRATRESVSDWFDDEGYRELGEKWNDLLTVLNLQAGVYLRANLLKINGRELIKKLSEEQISAKIVGGDEAALLLNERKNVFITETFKKGYFEVQDIGSQKIALFLDPKPGMRVIDACAGGGGKSLHIASLMQNKGRIVALDKNDWRLSPLRERASRAGADIIEARVISSLKIIKRLHNSADRLLLDVPCTGTGVLRRNPDAKWKLEQNQKAQLLEVQQDILQKYSSMTKVNGIMVYSTCSVYPSENQNQIIKFLNSQAGQGWILLDHLVIVPSVTEFTETVFGAPVEGGQTQSSEVSVTGVSVPRVMYLNSDGFYMARLQRTR